MKISQKIVALREQANLSQKEFAQKIGVSTGTVAEWESGDLEPSRSDISKIRACFTVPADMLIKETEPFDDFSGIACGVMEA